MSSEQSGEKFTLTFEEIGSYSYYGMQLHEIDWSDLTFILVDDSNSGVQWSPISSDLADVTFSSQSYGVRTLGVLELNCTVFDISGDGRASVGDYAEFTVVSGTLSESSGLVAYLLYDPVDAVIEEVQLSDY
jgi:hypothetical protein